MRGCVRIAFRNALARDARVKSTLFKLMGITLKVTIWKSSSYSIRKSSSYRHALSKAIDALLFRGV